MAKVNYMQMLMEGWGACEACNSTGVRNSRQVTGGKTSHPTEMSFNARQFKLISKGTCTSQETEAGCLQRECDYLVLSPYTLTYLR